MSLIQRAVAVGLAAGLVLVGCGEPEPEPDTGIDNAAVRFTRLQDTLVVVNEERADTVGLLRPTLDAFATVDAIVPLLLDEVQIDAGLERIPAARIALGLVDLDGSRAAILDVATAIDEARIALRRAEDVFTADADLAYLDATDEVLRTLRELSAAQDALAQVVERHLPVYESLVAVAEDFRERRSRFRSKREAADAFSVEARSTIRDLAVAQADVADFVRQRDVAARQFATAQAAADAAREAADAADPVSSDGP